MLDGIVLAAGFVRERTTLSAPNSGETVTQPSLPLPFLPTRTVSLVVYDFDGVMTDNRVLVDETGREAVMVNRSDGLAVSMMRALGIPQVILSTETNPVVAARAGKLRLPVVQGLADKVPALEGYAAEHGYDLAATVYIGNDMNDLEAMRRVGMPIAPADAHPLIRALAVFVTRARGGEGVVREFYESFLCDAGA
jgi:3-deoxy-D-manno-octulosonate 8-phosphate phosphatase (KDO 8-P phosphatase)